MYHGNILVGSAAAVPCFVRIHSQDSCSAMVLKVCVQGIHCQNLYLQKRPQIAIYFLYEARLAVVGTLSREYSKKYLGLCFIHDGIVL